MNWKDFFNRNILKKGRECYEQGRVSGTYLDETNNVFYANVSDDKDYSVSIENPGQDKMEMHCQCNSALSGFKCRHMAAALYCWDHTYIKNTEEVIEDNYVESVPFFNIPQIVSSLNLPPRDIELARRLISAGQVTLDDFTIFQTGSSYYTLRESYSARIAGTFRNDRGNYPMQMVINRDEVTRYHCYKCNSDYYRFYSTYSHTPCVHIIALILLAEKYTKAFDPGDYTDREASCFLRSFKDLSQKSEEECLRLEGSVALEPRITEADTGLELNFKIGNGGKLYVVKNLTTLYDTVIQKGTYELGKSGSIDFASATFNDNSTKLFNLIEREVKRGKAIERKMGSRATYYNSGTLETGKGVPFSGDTADLVYSTHTGGTIECKFQGDSKSCLLAVKDSNPVIDIRLDSSYDPDTASEEFIGIRLSGSAPHIVDGAATRYFISRNSFSRLDDNTYNMIKPFSDAGEEYGGAFNFLIGTKSISDFYYNILPELQKGEMFNIEDNVNFNSIVKEKAEFSFYMDIADDLIVCRAEVSYGDSSYDIKSLNLESFPLPQNRDLNQEWPVHDLLDSMFDYYSEEKSAFVIPDSHDAHFNLLKNGVNRLMMYGTVNSTEKFARIRIRKTPVAQLGISVQSNLLDLSIHNTDITADEFAEILKSYKDKKKYHKLRNGEYIEFNDNDSLAALINLLDVTGSNVKGFVKGKFQIPAYRALYLDKMLEQHEDLVSDRDRSYRQLIRNFKTISDADYDIPESLDKVLRPYQKHGFKWLKTLQSAGFGGILADDMGLGKTLQVIALVLSEEERRALVVCPASLVYNWTDEISRFAPELRAVAVTGSKSERKEILKNYEEYDFLITSYDLLKRDINMYDELEFTHQIIDEAQFIKNAGSIAAKSVKLINAAHKFALTGTPIENRLSELWSIYDYLMPGFLYNYEHFRKTFEIPISKKKDQVQTETLHNMIAPFILRRKKKDVLKDLPDKIEELCIAGFEGEQQKLYDAQVAKLKGIIESKSEDFNSSKIQILAEITRLRQICCDPALIYEDYSGGSAKLESCMDLIRSAIDGDHKMLVFSQFTSMLSIIEARLKQEQIDYYILTGSTPKEERLRLVNAFNSDKIPVFLISLKAGGTGLNLTGADIVIHYDPWWNKAAQNQATDRAHRIGQTEKVTVYQIISKDTIEEKIVELQNRKTEIADAVLSGETRSIGSMSKEELLELLGV